MATVSIVFMRHEGKIRSIETGRPLRHPAHPCNTLAQNHLQINMPFWLDFLCDHLVNPCNTAADQLNDGADQSFSLAQRQAQSDSGSTYATKRIRAPASHQCISSLLASGIMIERIRKAFWRSRVEASRISRIKPQRRSISACI